MGQCLRENTPEWSANPSTTFSEEPQSYGSAAAASRRHTASTSERRISSHGQPITEDQNSPSIPPTPNPLPALGNSGRRGALIPPDASEASILFRLARGHFTSNNITTPLARRVNGHLPPENTGNRPVVHEQRGRLPNGPMPSVGTRSLHVADSALNQPRQAITTREMTADEISQARQSDADEESSRPPLQRHLPSRIIPGLVPSQLDVDSRASLMALECTSTISSVQPKRTSDNAAPNDLATSCDSSLLHILYNVSLSDPADSIFGHQSYPQRTFPSGQNSTFESSARRTRNHTDNVVTQQMNLEEACIEDHIMGSPKVEDDIATPGLSSFQDTAAMLSTYAEAMEVDRSSSSRLVRLHLTEEERNQIEATRSTRRARLRGMRTSYEL